MLKIHKILFITLSNIGDVILTLPLLDVLRGNFPEAKITVMVSPRARPVFDNSPAVKRVIIYDKRSPIREKIKLFFSLKKEKFDLVIDLRNSLFGALLPVKYKTSAFVRSPQGIMPMKFRYLYCLPRAILSQIDFNKTDKGKSLSISQADEDYIQEILRAHKIDAADKLALIAAGARSHLKRWPKEKFSQLTQRLIKGLGLKIILVGDKDDAAITKYIAENSGYPLIDLAGKTTIAQLAALLKRSRLLITNDSAVLHLASYLNTPQVAIFGPTDELKYGPWSDISAVVKKDVFCRPCARALCHFNTMECMSLIKVEEVLAKTKAILNNQRKTMLPEFSYPYKRILVVRTDRIGDVLLSTPVIKALRDKYPDSYLAMMVSPYAKDIVEGNPYLDEVLVYDKDAKHKSWAASAKFARSLKKKKFDLAVILHPTNRVHLLTFFAGIPKRLGYNRKLWFLLTDKLMHTKQEGAKHELEYNLDLLAYLGIKVEDKNLFMAIRPESEVWADKLFQEKNINKDDKLLAIHPGASCPSKVWPQERFSQVADRLAEKYGFKILVIAGPKDLKAAEEAIKNMHQAAINLAGKTSVSQLASLLKKCRLFISNDSGPVHIASAVGTPVISIFGRNQPGLSPQRWGPVGKKDRFLHKQVGCIECLAHNCVKEFKCLEAISVEDVVKVAEEILSA